MSGVKVDVKSISNVTLVRWGGSLICETKFITRKMSDIEENNGIEECCGVCGDVYNIADEQALGNNCDLCHYHFLRRFGACFDEETGVEIRPRTVFASQEVCNVDWELDAIEESVQKYDLGALLRVTPDFWIQDNEDHWILAVPGRSGVDCLNDFLSADILNYDIKVHVCSYLKGCRVPGSCKPNCTGCFVCSIQFEIESARMSRTLNYIYEDVNNPVDGAYRWFYHGVISVCVRCGEIKPFNRVNMIRFGTCIDCSSQGIRFSRLEEGICPFTGIPSPAMHTFPWYRQLLVICVEEQRVVHRSVHYLARNAFEIEWPALENVEWFTK